MPVVALSDHFLVHKPGLGGGGVTRVIRAAQHFRGKSIFRDFRSIFIRIFKVLRGAKPVEIPRNQVSFHCKGILMKGKVTTNKFSQLRPRKSNDKNDYRETFLLPFKKLPISSGTITF